MRSRGIRLAKEDSMVVEGPILTANSHGDKFLCNNIPPCKGKVKVAKDPDVGQFLLNTPLLLENLTFEGPRLMQIPHLKLED